MKSSGGLTDIRPVLGLLRQVGNAVPPLHEVTTRPGGALFVMGVTVLMPFAINAQPGEWGRISWDMGLSPDVGQFLAEPVRSRVWATIWSIRDPWTQPPQPAEVHLAALLALDLIPAPRPVAIDGVRTFGTWVKFADSPEAARREALAGNRPVLLVYSLGDWTDPRGPGGDAERLRIGTFADPELGRYLNDQFVTAAVRVSSHPADRGGPVVSYFCRPDGAVLHAVVGPVGAREFRREAGFAVELYAKAAGRTDQELVAARHAVRDCQFDYLPDGYRNSLSKAWLPRLDPPEPMSDRVLRLRGGTPAPQEQVTFLIVAHPLAPVEDLHRVVWTKVLGQSATDPPR
jgi:hypothetical protein